MEVAFGVLGPVTAWDGTGRPIGLKGLRHRAVLARLIIARGRVVPVPLLAEELWEDPPAGAVGAIRTFVGALRRALEPGRPPRSPARILVTRGPGYALRAEPGAVDSWRFERAVEAASAAPPLPAAALLDEALGLWRGPAYAEFPDEPWAAAERSRLAELRLHAVERRAEARLAAGLAAETVPDLDAHVTGHPWREDAWRLLALALYRSGRQGDALAVLRRARTLLAGHLGVDPGPALRRLEEDILHQAPHLTPATASPSPPVHPPTEPTLLPQTDHLPPEAMLLQRTDHPSSEATPFHQADHPASEATRPQRADHPVSETRFDRNGRSAEQAALLRQEGVAGREAAGRAGRPGPGAAERVWAQAAAAYDRAVAAGARARLESAVGLLRGLAVTGGGGLEAAREHRLAAVAAAEELGDPELTARVIGSYDVPAIWTRPDDPEQAARIVAAAERALAALPPGGRGPVRARLAATIALESRGVRSPRALEAAREAERIARSLDDPALLAFALNGVFMQSFHRTGLAARRDRIGAELVELSSRHGLVTSEVLGHLIRLQALGALADFPSADRHADAADRLAARHEIPLVEVFTGWYRALRLSATGQATPAEQEAAYRDAARLLEGAGMPGLADGLPSLALLSVRLRHSLSLDDDPGQGPYAPWIRPLVLLERGNRAEATAALREAPDPPPGLLLEALWCLLARAAVATGDTDTMKRALQALSPASAELAGAGSGLLTLGPVSHYLDELTAALRHPR